MHRRELCLRFESLFYREELADEEMEFVLDHLSSCPLGVHTPEKIRRFLSGEAFGKTGRPGATNPDV